MDRMTRRSLMGHGGKLALALGSVGALGSGVATAASRDVVATRLETYEALAAGLAKAPNSGLANADAAEMRSLFAAWRQSGDPARVGFADTVLDRLDAEPRTGARRFADLDADGALSQLRAWATDDDQSAPAGDAHRVFPTQAMARATLASSALTVGSLPFLLVAVEDDAPHPLSVSLF